MKITFKVENFGILSDIDEIIREQEYAKIIEICINKDHLIEAYLNSCFELFKAEVMLKIRDINALKKNF